MEKTIKIGEKELQVRSSLFTVIEYKSIFGTDLFNDVAKISTKEGETEISSVIQTLFQIIYILHRPFEKAPFEDFISSFDFSILNDTKALEDISTVIGELLGAVKNAPKGQTKTQNP